MWKCFRIFVTTKWDGGWSQQLIKPIVWRPVIFTYDTLKSRTPLKHFEKKFGSLKNFSYLYNKFETYRWWKILGIQTKKFFKLLKHIAHSRFVLHSVTTAAYGRQINYESRIKWIVRFTQSAVSSSDGAWVGKWDIILALYVRVTL